jgi:hypothetical protein
VNRKPLQLALRELQVAFTSPRVLVGMAAVSLILGLSGPFNTFADFPMGQRIVYWLGMVVSTYAVGQGAATFTLALIGARLRALWLRTIVAGLICGVPVTLVVFAVNAIAYGARKTMNPLELWGDCTMISLAVVAATTAMVRGAPELPPIAPVQVPPPILERIPHPQRGALMALSVQDHYVAVVTEKGTSLVLMRLSDAIKETGAVAGLQIHRSHWVARDAVKRVIRTEGKISLELRSGARLPVSRGYLDAVKAAGLLV